MFKRVSIIIYILLVLVFAGVSNAQDSVQFNDELAGQITFDELSHSYLLLTEEFGPVELKFSHDLGRFNGRNVVVVGLLNTASLQPVDLGAPSMPQFYVVGISVNK